MYQWLPPEEKAEVDFWMWSGYTMHKKLNAVKGGVDRMARRWKEFNDGKLLIVMMSKSKAVAADSGMVLEEVFARGR